MGPNAKKLTKNSIYRAAIKLWCPLATLVNPIPDGFQH